MSENPVEPARRLVKDNAVLFIDLPNLHCGSKEPHWGEWENRPRFDVQSLMRELGTRYRLVRTNVYGDFSRWPAYGRLFASADRAVRLLHQPPGGKNGTDFAMVSDMTEQCLHNPHVATVVVGSADQDMIHTVSLLQSAGKRVVGVGPRRGTSGLALQRYDVFHFLEEFEDLGAGPVARVVLDDMLSTGCSEEAGPAGSPDSACRLAEDTARFFKDQSHAQAMSFAVFCNKLIQKRPDLVAAMKRSGFDRPALFLRQTRQFRIEQQAGIASIQLAPAEGATSL